jgi:hypothetical protein
MSICANLISNIIYYLNGSLPQVPQPPLNPYMNCIVEFAYSIFVCQIGSSINSAPITTQLTTINTQVQSSISTVQSLLSQTGIIFVRLRLVSLHVIQANIHSCVSVFRLV